MAIIMSGKLRPLIKGHLRTPLHRRTAVNRQNGSRRPMEMQMYKRQRVPFPVQAVTFEGKTLLPGCQRASNLSHCTSCKEIVCFHTKDMLQKG